jgi:UDP-N-acetylmuramoyl-L-alanyl-D-glutamate--2,6-diaminopimelate ligase
MLLDAVNERLGVEITGTSIQVSGISNDSNDIQAGYIFAALPGAHHHGIVFASDAIDKGAVAILTDATGAGQILTEVPLIVVDNPRVMMAMYAKEIHGDPFSSLLTIGVTGTNGKTTTTHMIANALTQNGFNPLLIGTLGFRYKGEYASTHRTTPESCVLYREVQSAYQAGANSVVMEVSSHALALDRVAGIMFDVAIFTGLSPDHLDFHGTMEDYYQAKKKLFSPTFAKSAIVCIDDEWGRRLSAEIDIPTTTYTTLDTKAQWAMRNYQISPQGFGVFSVEHEAESFEMNVSMPGLFNAANALATLACSDFLNLDSRKVASSLESVSVKGRLERIDIGQDFSVLVDYAHTPDAVERVLAIARQIAGNHRVITVLGCGGNRDSLKRPLMGALAASASDLFIATDDNPRDEDPNTIREQMLQDVQDQSNVIEIGDRQAAIHYAIKHSAPGDCVMILGKGHEVGQEIQGQIHPFDDSVVAIEALNAHIS